MRPYDAAAGIALHLGDCVRMLAGLQPRVVDLVVTDPPWNLGLDYGVHHDDLPLDQYEAWLAGIVTSCAGLGARRLVYLPGRHHLARIDAVLADSGMSPTVVLRWQRGQDWEPIVVAQTPDAPRAEAPVPATFRVPRPAAEPSSGHPCPKPLGLIEWILRAYAWHGAIVLDPFAGTGTTLVAARRAGLRAIGIEQEERFYAAAARRLDRAA